MDIGGAAARMTNAGAVDDLHSRKQHPGLSVVTDMPNSSIHTTTVIGPDGFKIRAPPNDSPMRGEVRPPSGGADIGGGVVSTRRASPSASTDECMSPLHGDLGTSAGSVGAGTPHSPKTPSSAKSSSGRSPMLNGPKLRVSSIVRRLSATKTTMTPPSANSGGNSYIDFEDSPLLMPAEPFGGGGGGDEALVEAIEEGDGSERNVPADDTDLSTSPVIESGSRASSKGGQQLHDHLTLPAELMGGRGELGIFSPTHDAFTPNSLDLEGAPQEETKDHSNPRRIVVDKGLNSHLSPTHAASPSKETAEQREARLDTWEARLREQQRIHEDREAELSLYQQTISGVANERSSSRSSKRASAAGGLAGLVRSRGGRRQDEGQFAAWWHWASEATISPTDHYFSVYASAITVLGIAGFVEAPLVLAFSTKAMVGHPSQIHPPDTTDTTEQPTQQTSPTELSHRPTPPSSPSPRSKPWR